MRLNELKQGDWFIDGDSTRDPLILLGPCRRHPRGVQAVRGVGGKLVCFQENCEGLQLIDVTITFEVDDA